MIPLAVQLLTFGILLALRGLGMSWPFLDRAGAIAIGVMLLFTGVYHFVKIEAMVQMFPPSIPMRETLVLASGAFEIAVGLCLIAGLGPIPTIGYALGAFLLLAMPLNIYSALSGSGLGAKGLSYLWFRVPLQAFWLWWVWRFLIREP